MIVLLLVAASVSLTIQVEAFFRYLFDISQQSKGDSLSFEILLFGYSVDGGEVQVVDMAQGEKIPEEVIKMLVDENVLKTAYNAAFERVCLSAYLHRNYPGLISTPFLSPASWHCTMVWAAYCGYPLSLKDAGMAMGLEKQKLEEGKELIRYFCVPCNPSSKTQFRQLQRTLSTLRKS